MDNEASAGRQQENARKRQRRVEEIECHYSKPPLRERRYFPLPELAQRAIQNRDTDPDQLVRFLQAFVNDLMMGKFDGPKGRPRIYLAQPDPQFPLRLDRQFLGAWVEIHASDPGADIPIDHVRGSRAVVVLVRRALLERLLSGTWMPRDLAVPWLKRHDFHVPEWLEEQSTVPEALNVPIAVPERTKSRPVDPEELPPDDAQRPTSEKDIKRALWEAVHKYGIKSVKNHCKDAVALLAESGRNVADRRVMSVMKSDEKLRALKRPLPGRPTRSSKIGAQN